MKTIKSSTEIKELELEDGPYSVRKVSAITSNISYVPDDHIEMFVGSVNIKIEHRLLMGNLLSSIVKRIELLPKGGVLVTTENSKYLVQDLRGLRYEK